LAEENTARLMEWIKERQDRMENTMETWGRTLGENQTSLVRMDEFVKKFNEEILPMIRSLSDDMKERHWKADFLKYLMGGLVSLAVALSAIIGYMWPIIQEAAVKMH
jgi:hypothetical protein